MQQNKIHIDKVLTTLELPLDSFKLMSAKSAEEAEMILQKFKALVKKQHHILVKKYHPDLPANGEVEELKMKQVNAMIDIVKQLKITKSRPRPQKVTVRFYQSPRSGSNRFNSDSSTTNFFYNSYS